MSMQDGVLLSGKVTRVLVLDTHSCLPTDTPRRFMGQFASQCSCHLGGKCSHVIGTTVCPLCPLCSCSVVTSSHEFRQSQTATGHNLYSKIKSANDKYGHFDILFFTGSLDQLENKLDRNAKGVSQLPVARVKRIIKKDKDVQIVSNETVFLINIATVRKSSWRDSQPKPSISPKLEKRKMVLYKDLATTVTQYDSLESLQDTLEKQPIAKEKEESGAVEEEDEGEQETNEQGEDSDEEQQQSASEDVTSSRPMSDDDELSGPDDMDEN
ncbi:MAG: hypothetical protein J3Q66DRAFT_374684 [Benniella sp.]|nr:MAG: hypothetical protein J3Q66DRAFT_374684 [Benniella sp.]